MDALSKEGTNDKNEDKKTEEPKLDDDFVKTLGDFKNVEDFKTKLKENLQKEKEIKEFQKRRLEIIENIIKETKIEIPKILIDQELERMFGQFQHDVERMKMKTEDYLKEIKKTKEDLKKEWKVDAEKRVIMNMILPNIAAKEKIKADEEKVKKEVKHLMEHHKDVSEQHATIYVNNIITNEEVFKFLEKLGSNEEDSKK